MPLPALLNPKPHGDVGDMEQGHTKTMSIGFLMSFLCWLRLQCIVFHLERKRHSTWGYGFSIPTFLPPVLQCSRASEGNVRGLAPASRGES